MKLSELMKKQDSLRINIAVYSTEANMIMTIISKYFNVPIQAIEGKSRSMRLAEPRQWFHFMARDKVGKLSLAAIGWYTGDRDHATVMHSLRKIGGRMKVRRKNGTLAYPEIRARYDELSNLIDLALNKKRPLEMNEYWALTVGNAYNIHNN